VEEATGAALRLSGEIHTRAAAGSPFFVHVAELVDDF
jgi:hypothetical protein